MKTEYGCEDLAKIRYRVVSTTGINITNGVIGIVLAWYQEVRVKPQLQQDVEEFIDEHELVSSSGSEVNSLIRASDLRAWMTGRSFWRGTKRTTGTLRMIRPPYDSLQAAIIACIEDNEELTLDILSGVIVAIEAHREATPCVTKQTSSAQKKTKKHSG